MGVPSATLAVAQTGHEGGVGNDNDMFCVIFFQGGVRKVQKKDNYLTLCGVSAAVVRPKCARKGEAKQNIYLFFEVYIYGGR